MCVLRLGVWFKELAAHSSCIFLFHRHGAKSDLVDANGHTPRQLAADSSDMLQIIKLVFFWLLGCMEDMIIIALVLTFGF